MDSSLRTEKFGLAKVGDRGAWDSSDIMGESGVALFSATILKLNSFICS